MKKIFKWATVSILGLALVACGNDQDIEAENSDSGDAKIVLITMDSTDQHWVSMNNGAEAKAKELGNIDFTWAAPDQKDDAQQIERINNAISENVDAIMIAANGKDAVTTPLKEAIAEGIKIIYVDSPANAEGEATFATDNFEAGKVAGVEMLDELTNKNISEGKIGIINFNSAAETAIMREEGFRSVFEDSNFTLMETQYSDGDAVKSQEIADNYISLGAVGLFGTNEGSTVGTGNAIKASDRDVVGVGFDKSDAILSLVRDGSLLLTIGQNPEKMGSLGLEAAINAIQGNEITDKNVDTGVVIINQENVDE